MWCECGHASEGHVRVAEYIVCLGCLRTRPPTDLTAPCRIVCTIDRPKVAA